PLGPAAVQVSEIGGQHRHAAAYLLTTPIPAKKRPDVWGQSRTTNMPPSERPARDPYRSSPCNAGNAKTTAGLPTNFSLLPDRADARAAAQTPSHQAHAGWTHWVDRYQTSQTRTF